MREGFCNGCCDSWRREAPLARIATLPGVTEHSSPSPPWSPWPERFYARTPLPAWLIGVGAALVALAVLFVGGWTLGGLQEFLVDERSVLEARDARSAVLLCALIGSLPTALFYVMRFTRANLATLPGASAPLELARPSRLAVTLPGLLAFPLIAFSVDRDPLLYFQPIYYLDAVHWFTWLAGIFVTVHCAWLVYLTLGCASALADHARQIERIDLFDLPFLAPLARQGLLSTLVWLLILSMFSVNAVDSAFTVPILGMTLLVSVVSGVALLRCNGPIHRRIRAAKHAEIASIDAALRGDENARSRLAIARPGELSVADLLSYRTFVADAQEWAFDGASWVRFALVLLLPLGSWLGGALVERGVETAFG